MFSDTRTNGTLEESIRFIVTDNLLAFVCVNLNACLSRVQFRLAQPSSVEGLKIAALEIRWPKSG